MDGRHWWKHPRLSTDWSSNQHGIWSGYLQKGTIIIKGGAFKRKGTMLETDKCFKIRNAYL